MNVVIYARYSSDRQTEQSIEGQLKECYEYARRNGYTVVGEYIDRAISGTTDHRPEFLRMIADGDKKLFQAVLVYQLARFARNRYDSATYKAKLKKNGIRVLSARENISDDASGVLMEAVLEGMAEYYSVELSQKIRRGMDINAEKCLSTGGNVALGFRVDSEKRIQLDPDTAPLCGKFLKCMPAVDPWQILSDTSMQTTSKPPMEMSSTKTASTAFSATSDTLGFTPTGGLKPRTDYPASSAMTCFMRCRI